MSPILPKQCVLVVDDSPENIALLSEILRDDYRVRVATSGEKALVGLFDPGGNVVHETRALRKCQTKRIATSAEYRTCRYGGSTLQNGGFSAFRQGVTPQAR